MQALSGLSFVMIVDLDGTVLADTDDPGRIGKPLSLGPSTAGSGRAWTGDRTDLAPARWSPTCRSSGTREPSQDG